LIGNESFTSKYSKLEIVYLLKSFIDDVDKVNVEFGAIGCRGNNLLGFC